MTASKGLRPALLFLSSAASLTTASISARKLSKGTRELSASSGSPLALIALRRLSRSKKPGCPTAFPCATDLGTRESDLRRARQCYFSRCPYVGVRLLVSVHHRLWLLTFPMRTVVLSTSRPGTRSPSFRCDPFARDVAFDPGRATAPRIAVQWLRSVHSD